MMKHRVFSWFRSPSLLSHKKAPQRCASLHLEHLEGRIVPAVAPNDVYVSSLFQGFLGRNADPGGLAYWDGLLNAGKSRAQVALGIENSDEFTGRAVQIYYLDFFGRAADSGGVNFWVNMVRQGTALEQVKADIFGSAEFFAVSGGNFGSFLNAVYEAELGRSVDPAGVAYWSSHTANDTTGRAEAALGIMNSNEGERVLISSLYQTILGRLPGSAGTSFWLDAFHQGASNADVAAGIAGSDEYFTKLEAFAATATDPNAAAHAFIVSMNLFDRTLPGAQEFNATIATDPSLVLPPPVVAPSVSPHGFHRGVGFFTGGATTGPYFTGGPVVTGGYYVPTGGYAPTGGFTGGGSSGGGSGGGSGSLRAAAPPNGAANEGVRGVGGRGQGGGLYVGRGLISLANIPLVGSPAPSDNGQLTNQELQATVTFALARLESAGISSALLTRLETTTFEVGLLPEPLLGYTFAKAHTVVIDADAAGFGWFVDPTAQSDADFMSNAAGALTAIPGGPAYGKMDLLTAVFHEMGHIAGFGDISTQQYPNNLMDGTLAAGVRRTDDLGAIFAGGLLGHSSFV